MPRGRVPGGHLRGLPAIFPPEALLLTAPFSLAGFETGFVPFRALDGSYQVTFFRLSRLDPPLHSNGPHLIHLHLNLPLIVVSYPLCVRYGS